jgi:hypothetical protein
MPDETALSLIDSIDTNAVTRTLEKIAQFQQIIQKALKPGHDFGYIPGVEKPSLFKPGAEKINMLMGLSTEYAIMDKTEDYDKGFFAYNVRCIISRNGNLICEGVGNCNSREKKYVTQDPFTIANTILKMGKKRAYVDATLSLASLSDIFTQDLEDLDGARLKGNGATNADNQGRAPGDVVLTFGKHKGRAIADLYKNEKYYFDWLMGEKDGKPNNEKMKPICEAYLKSLEQPADEAGGNGGGGQQAAAGTETPRPKARAGNGEVNWDSFNDSARNLGFAPDQVLTIASEIYGREVQDLKDVIKNQAEASKLLSVLAKRRNETAAQAS